MGKIPTFLLLGLLSLVCFLHSDALLMAQSSNNDWLNVEHLAMPAPTLVLTQKTLLRMGIDDDLLPTGTAERDELGYVHRTYQQTYKGIPVEGAILLLHERNGVSYLANGTLVPNLQADSNPTLSQEQALQRALAHSGAQRYAWQDPQYEAIIKEIKNNTQATFYPSGELVWVAPLQAGKNAQAYRLAYKLDIYALEPLGRAYVYIDAQNGKIIDERQLLHDADVAATGNDAYSCNNPVNITADNAGGLYRLRETQRGGGIQTYTAMNSTSHSDIDITDTDTYFNSDPVAISAHRCTEATYDYYKNTYNRNSIDGNGYQLKSWVHYGANYDNAFWNGAFMTYGDGGGDFLPLTAPDVVAHEITHGLTQFEANLVYAYEPGALNESFSDIFGTVVEYQANAACADWIIGSDIALTANGLRSMSNPNDATMRTRCPDTYGGTFWNAGSLDNGGVHTNSGVQNFWFYLLSNGGNGTNDNGYAYNVSGIGMNKAARIAYRNLCTYLSSTSQYTDARAGSIQAATDLYGAGSNEVAQVTAAWCAVGVCSASSNALTLTSPNGSEVWLYNSTHNITWTTTGTVPTVNIAYSIDGGATWSNIAVNAANTGSYAWVVPNVSTQQAKMRVSATLNPGLLDMSNAFFSIQGCNIVAGFSAAPAVCQNTATTFTNASSGIGTLVYAWQINGTAAGTTANLNYNFATAGTFNVSLTVGNGVCSNTYAQTITVTPTATATFTHTQNGLTLSAFATQLSANSYTWNFGDGTTATAQNATHTYAAAGTYNVCLTLSNSCGSNNTCQNVAIAANCQDTWTQYTNGDYISAIAEEGGFMWIGTDVGLVRINKTTGATTFYNTANSGLPNNYISAIAIDTNGDKWIGTDSGLAKFNGSTWTVYNTSNSGLPHNFINAIAIDSNGDKWIGTNSGVAKFNGSTWTVYNTGNSGLPNNSISAITIDTNGDKWIGTNGGVAKFNGSTWTVYNSSNSGLPSNFINAIAIDTNGEKWIGTYGGGVAKFNGSTWTVYTASNSGLPNNNIQTIAIDTNGEKWIGTFGGGVAKFNGSTWTVYNTSNSGLPSNRIWAIAIDTNGNKWIGTYNIYTGDGGLTKFNGSTWTVYNTSNSGLPSNRIWAIAIDTNGDKWIGTDNGLAKFNGSTWTIYNSSNSGLPNNSISSIAIDNNGDKWIGTGSIYGNGNGLAKFNGTTWTVYNTSNSGLPSNVILAITIGANGDKWIGTSAGVAKFNGSTWTVYNTSNSGLPINNIRAIAIDNSGDKWIGTGDIYGTGGLAKFNGSTWTVYNTSNSGLPYNGISAIAIDTNGDKWIGTGSISDDGIGLAKLNGNTWTVYNSSNSGLPNDTIVAIAIDTNGDKWIGTGSGLAKFNGSTWTVYNTSNSGLPSNRIWAIAIDTNGNKWIGTDSGVGVLGNCSALCAATASFSAPATPICSNTPITFTNSSTGATTYQWKVNGANVSTATNLTYTFTTAGTYSISVVATNGTCSNTYTQNITINSSALNLNLPDVSTCGTSAVLNCGIPNALYYMWNLGETLVGTTQTLNVTQSGTYTLSVADICGNVGFDSVNVLLDGDCVWAGDFNYDGTTNNYDLLYWGWAAGSSGSPRPNASFVWEAQPCADWVGTQQDGINYKYADGNGNGIIDNSDPQAIIANYGLTHGTAPAVGNTGSPLSIVPVINQMPSLIGNNTIVYIDLYLNNDGNSSTTLYGTAFKANYLFPTAFHIDNAYLDFSGSWLGTEGIDMRSVQKNFINANNNGGYIEVAVSRNNHQNATGSSKVATLVAQVDVVNSGVPMATVISATNAQVSLANGNIMGISNSSNISFSLSPAAATTGLVVQPTVWLKGAYNSDMNLMKTTLRNNNLLPLQQPYNVAPYNYAGTEAVTTISNMPSNVVDWVLLELRSADNIQQNIARKAAFLLSNGSVVDADSISNGVRFPTVVEGNYYVVIRHRNHVDVISANAVSLANGTATSIDFGNPANVMGGITQLTVLANGQYALKSGDFDGNGVIQLSDFNLFSIQVGSTNQYRSSDCNLDGQVTIADFNACLLNPSAVGVSAIRY